MGAQKGLILALFLLAGCVTAPAPVENPRQVWCDQNVPRRPSPEVVAAMTRAELDEMNAFNRTGVKWCGWKA